MGEGEEGRGLNADGAELGAQRSLRRKDGRDGMALDRKSPPIAKGAMD
jgi:hypothetical protein